MKIQFFGAKQDSDRVRDVFRKMVERGRVANITLVPQSLTFREEAVLQIQVSVCPQQDFAHKIAHKFII